jgi:hypothetical protein
MKTIPSMVALFCLLALLILGGCGGGGSSDTTPPSQATPAATKAIVKLSSVGTLPTGTQLKGVAVTVKLPAGLSVATDASGAVVTGAVTTSGVAAQWNPVATYAPATHTLQVIIAGNFGVGEFATITCDIASGSAVPTKTDLVVTGFLADSTESQATGLTTDFTLDLQ